jgi:multiple sugar transport system substrate-binding protein
MTKFQLVLMGIFGFFIVLAVAVFALYRGSNASLEASLTVWGDIPAEEFAPVAENVIPTLDKNITLRYEEIPANKIDEEFTEALARGEGPDLLLITQENFWKNKSKLMVIPYGGISQRDFRDTFVEESALFLATEGIYAIPLSVDPMVLYYNRDLLSSAGQAKPIAYWDEIYTLTQRLTKRDGAGNIVQSAIALGETRNINNYKEILSLLLLQAGTPITALENMGLRPVLDNNFALPVAPADSALDFYTQFSNPAKAYYSWNRNLPEAQTAFTSGDSVYYLGFASELVALRNKNPNLNIGVAHVPQSRVAGKTLTYGRVNGVAISRGTKNPAAAMRAAVLLSSDQATAALSTNSGLPSARRDLLSVKPTDSITPVFYEAALQSRGWIDPENFATRQIFQNMIDSITSGRARTSEAVSAANRSLESLIK